MRFIPIVGFVVLVVVLAFMLLVRPVGNEAGPDILPQLVLEPYASKVAWNQEALKGEVVAINVFASWCVPCTAEMPELAKLKKNFPGLKLHGVAWNDSEKTLANWFKKHGNPFDAVWLDPKGSGVIALGIKGVPETLILDRESKVRYRLSGPLTPAVEEAEIAPLLKALGADRAR